MPRRTLSEGEKTAMKEGRGRTAAERLEAHGILSENPQFLNPKFWKREDENLLQAVEKAISKGRRLAIADELSRVQKLLADVKAERARAAAEARAVAKARPGAK